MPDDLNAIRSITSDFVQNENVDSGELTPEGRLWAYADELFNLKEPIKNRQTGLYREIEGMRRTSLNLHEKEILGSLEREYWRQEQTLLDISQREAELEEALVGLESGEPDMALIDRIAPKPQPLTEKISKKKAAKKKDLMERGLNQDEADWYIYLEFGPIPTNDLTTGRNRSAYRGNAPANAAIDEFYYQTADTHGGKVSHGKGRGSNSYTNNRGIRIRKA